MTEAALTTLVTGASSGIGEQFALQLGRRGHNLILTARSEDKMRALAQRLRTENPRIGVDVIAADLAKPGSGVALTAELASRGVDVDVLINNAGFGSHNPVAEEDPDNLAREIQLNCSSLVDLTARLLPAMLRRDRGGVLNVASTAAYQRWPRWRCTGRRRRSCCPSPSRCGPRPGPPACG